MKGQLFTDTPSDTVKVDKRPWLSVRVCLVWSLLLADTNLPNLAWGGSKWPCQFSAFRGSDKAQMGLERCLSVRECRFLCYCKSKPVEEEKAANLQWPAIGNRCKERNHGERGGQRSQRAPTASWGPFQNGEHWWKSRGHADFDAVIMLLSATRCRSNTPALLVQCVN